MNWISSRDGFAEQSKYFPGSLWWLHRYSLRSYSFPSVVWSRRINVSPIFCANYGYPGRSVRSTDNSTRGHPHGHPYVYPCGQRVYTIGHPYGYPRSVTIYFDIHTDIRVDVRVELSVLRTLRPGYDATTNKNIKKREKIERGVAWAVGVVLTCLFEHG